MKKGITSTLAFELEIQISDVEQVIFTFKEKVNSEEYLLQKEYPSESVIFEDNKFKCKLTQEETDSLSNTFFVEAQINLLNKSVIKSDICKKIMPPTLWTTFVEDNESSGEEEIISLTFTDYVEGGGSGGTTNYNELSNKPKYNGIEWVGNKTDSDMGIATKGELQTKADKVDTYTKEETNTLLGSKQDTLADGNGVKIENDEISVYISNNSGLDFSEERLTINSVVLGRNQSLRQSLTSTTGGVTNPLASKSYVDNLMSGAVKRLVVEQLPQNPNTYTIYMVLRQAPTTNNIYDEYMYINNAWELIGSTEVDLSNYYTKTESDNKYQPIIDSSHKVSADNIDDSQSTNKFVHKSNTSDNLIKIKNDGLQVSGGEIANDSYFLSVAPYNSTLRSRLLAPDGTNDFQPKLTAGTNITIDSNNVISASGGGSYSGGNGIDITNNTIKVDLISSSSDLIFVDGKLGVDETALGTSELLRQRLASTNHNYPLQPKLTAGTNITIDSNNVISASGGGSSYSGGDGIDITNDTISVDIASGSALTITSGELDVDLSNYYTKTETDALSTDATFRQALARGSEPYALASLSGMTTALAEKQNVIDSSHKLSADLVDTNGTTNQFLPVGASNGKFLGYGSGGASWVTINADLIDDTSTTNKFTNATEKSTWNGKEDKTTISTDTTSTTVSLTLADNHEYRYTQELSSLTLTMPNGDFIASVVFSSGSTPTQMTYDSSIKWSGDDISNGQFVPTEKTYNIVMWYDGININGVVRGVA